MFIAISIVIFFLLNYWGMRTACGSKTYHLSSVADRNVKWQFTSPEIFIFITVVFALIDASPPGMLAMKLLLWILFTLLGIIHHRIGLKINNMVILLYVLYLSWLILSLTYTPAFEYGLRTFLKYLLPFLLLLFVPALIKNELLLPLLVKYLYWIFFAIVCFYLIAVFIGYQYVALIQQIIWWRPAIVDSIGVFFAVTVIYAYQTGRKKYLWMLLGCLLYSICGYVIRTGLIVITFAIITLAFFRFRWAAIPFIATAAAGFLGALVYIPQVRSKMFFEDIQADEVLLNLQSLQLDQINSNGRFTMWQELLDLFYHPHPWTGSGIGVQQDFMYKNWIVGSNVAISHNDYVQLLCDVGLIGTILYLGVLLSLLVHCFFIYNNRKLSESCRFSALIAGVSISGMAVAMLTDNVVNYTMATLVFPFTFYGMALGLKAKPETDSLPESDGCRNFGKII